MWKCGIVPLLSKKNFFGAEREKEKTMKKMLAVAVVSMVALTAQAGIEANFVMTGTGQIDGNDFNIYAVQVTTDTDWTNSRLEMSLSAGSFGNHSFGSGCIPRAGER